ncbi:MAG: glycosyltransferase family 4 protein [Pirellulales bacterium]|nr:glycosyltransferase family 4 protein [Pirellulales bacterium]
MRVALVLKQLDPRRGGAEQWTTQFAAALVQRGHEVHVVAQRFGEQVGHLSIVAHPVRRVRSRLAFAEAAQAKLMAIAPDIIHDMGVGWYCDVFHPHAGSWASVTERKLRLVAPWLRPLKQRVDRWLPRQREYRTLVSRQYADNGQIMLALSETAADDFRRFHGVPSERIRIVYNGVDTVRFSPEHRGLHRRAVRRRLGVSDETVLALIVAHNFRLKGLPALLGAMSRLTAERVPLHLAVVGGKHLRPWEWTARRLGLGGSVSFLGAVDDTVPYYAAADLYVHPTFYDMCSLVVLEAAASGLPILTTRINGVSELLTQGTEGLLISDPADVDELTDRMRALFDESLRLKMARAARQMALRHTLKRNVDEILDVYEEVIEMRRPAVSRKPPARPPVGTAWKV